MIIVTFCKLIFKPNRILPPCLLTQVSYRLHAPEGARKLDLYKKIRQKDIAGIKNNQLNQQSFEKYYKVYRCDGCNSSLQSQDKHKYGFIKQEVLDRTIQTNIHLIQNTYGHKASQSDSKTLEIISQVQQQIGRKIFNNDTKKLDHLDDVETLLRLQEKIDLYEEEQQTIKRMKKDRKELYCQRCYSLKYHNKLPDEYDVPESQHSNNQQILMSKIIKKHNSLPTTFIYLIDVLDIAGTFKKYVFDRLLDADVTFCVVINKLDIVNLKYLNQHLILDEVKKMMIEFISDREESERVKLRQKIEGIKVMMSWSIDRTGVKAIENYLEKTMAKRIQLVGFPNTGKTTLLNQLGRLNKPTSKVPGTTLYITQHRHKKYIFFDMPGMNAEDNISSLISKPNLKSLLTWNKFYSPPVLLHQAYFFGGKVEIRDVKVILFGMGGACSSDNRWFILNYKEFWKGLPPLHELQIQRYTIDLQFVEGKSKDLEIAGWGFISFRLAFESKKPVTRMLTLYLPKGISYHLRGTVLKDSEVLNYKSVVKRRHRLQRVHQQKRKQFIQKSND